MKKCLTCKRGLVARSNHSCAECWANMQPLAKTALHVAKGRTLGKGSLSLRGN